MSAVSMQQARAAARSLIADLALPERCQVVTLLVGALVLALVALVLLLLLKASYEPMVWAVLLFTGAGWGWFAHNVLSETEEGD